ncbi:MAG TPA: NAD-binding protein [Trebonia sp.]|nr:NAD-binding protein [Trebonia sp.]
MTEIRPDAGIGFIGLGKMGGPMSLRLAEAGYRVRGYDVSEAALRSWAGRVPGAAAAASPAAAAEVRRVRPLLDVLGSRVLHVGDVGAGHAVKALNNLLSATHLLVTSEAMAAAAAFDSGFALRLMLKDMRIALGIAEAAGTECRLSGAAVELWAQAAADLPADADHTEIARWLESR